MYTCLDCGVTSEKYQPVTGYLHNEPKEGELRIAIVGEAPGETERLRNIPFVGESGQLLRKTLANSSIDLQTCLLTNVLCCQLVDDANPTHEQLDLGRMRLLCELQDFKPDRILALGNSPMIALMGNDFQKQNGRITDTRGCWYECTYLPGVQVMPTFHPAYILREAIWFRDFAGDCSKVKKEIITFEKPKVYKIDSLVQMGSCLYNDIKKEIDTKGSCVCSIDIETAGFNAYEDKILSIGISFNDKTSYIVIDDILYDKSIGFGNYNVLGLLQELADDPRITWVGHNSAVFDIPFMRIQLGLKFPIHFDTMLAHYALDERKRTHRLKTIARDRLNLPNYEKGLKKYLIDDGATFADIPRDELYQYQAYDTAVTWRLYWILKNELKAPAVRNMFEKILMPAAEMLGDVRQNGVCIDVPYLEWLQSELREKLAEKVNRVREAAGKPALNPNSTKQLAVLLYDELGLPKPPDKKDGSENRSTNAHYLQQLEDWDMDSKGVIPELLSMRKMAKILSTYVTGLLSVLSSDGKAQPNLMLHGTETGRLASASPNIQNIPRESKGQVKGEYPYGNMIRYAFKPSPGYKLVAIDYSQIEFRCACWLSRDPGFMAAFNSGADFHTTIAALVYGVPVDQVTYFQRFSMKAVNFGIMYGRGATSLVEGELRSLVLDVDAYDAATSNRIRAMMVKEAQQKAQRFINDFQARFPVNTKYLQDTAKSLLEKKFVESPFGRRRRFPLIMDRNKAEIQREGVNAVIQSMASDMCLMAGHDIHNTLPKDDVRILFFVHDAIMFEIKEGLLETYLPQIQHIMEKPSILKGDYVIPWKVEIDILNDRWNIPPDEYIEPYLKKVCDLQNKETSE